MGWYRPLFGSGGLVWRDAEQPSTPPADQPASHEAETAQHFAERGLVGTDTAAQRHARQQRGLHGTATVLQTEARRGGVDLSHEDAAARVGLALTRTAPSRS